MIKKILFLFIFALMVAPAGFAGALNYYVGVEITSAQAPGYPAGETDTNYCLPKHTSLAIRSFVNGDWYDLEDISPSSNPIDVPVPICAGDTFWSGLVEIENGIEYQAYISIPDRAYCPGLYDYVDGDIGSSGCWVSWDAGKNCADTCLHYGLAFHGCWVGGGYGNYAYTYQPIGRQDSDALNCGIIKFLSGRTDCGCYTSATDNFYNPENNGCYTTTTTCSSSEGGTYSAGSTKTMACRCLFPATSGAHNFTFTFTPT